MIRNAIPSLSQKKAKRWLVDPRRGGKNPRCVALEIVAAGGFFAKQICAEKKKKREIDRTDQISKSIYTV